MDRILTAGGSRIQRKKGKVKCVLSDGAFCEISKPLRASREASAHARTWGPFVKENHNGVRLGHSSPNMNRPG